MRIHFHKAVYFFPHKTKWEEVLLLFFIKTAQFHGNNFKYFHIFFFPAEVLDGSHRISLCNNKQPEQNML